MLDTTLLKMFFNTHHLSPVFVADTAMITRNTTLWVTITECARRWRIWPDCCLQAVASSLPNAKSSPATIAVYTEGVRASVAGPLGTVTPS